MSMSRLVELVRMRLRLKDLEKPKVSQRRWYATLWKRRLDMADCLLVILRWRSGILWMLRVHLEWAGWVVDQRVLRWRQMSDDAVR